MATKTLEARFEHLSVKEEKENGSDRTYSKNKVLGVNILKVTARADLFTSRAPFRRPSLCLAWARLR